MSPFDTLLVILCGGVGFTLQGAVGFGMGILGSPMLILIDSRLVPGPVLASSMVFTALLTVRERSAIDLVGLRWAIVGRAAGTIPAAAVLAVLPAEQLSLLFGGIVLVAVAISISTACLVLAGLGGILFFCLAIPFNTLRLVAAWSLLLGSIAVAGIGWAIMSTLIEAT